VFVDDGVEALAELAVPGEAVALGQLEELAAPAELVGLEAPAELVELG